MKDSCYSAFKNILFYSNFYWYFWKSEYRIDFNRRIFWPYKFREIPFGFAKRANYDQIHKTPRLSEFNAPIRTYPLSGFHYVHSVIADDRYTVNAIVQFPNWFNTNEQLSFPIFVDCIDHNHFTTCISKFLNLAFYSIQNKHVYHQLPLIIYLQQSNQCKHFKDIYNTGQLITISPKHMNLWLYAKKWVWKVKPLKRNITSG